MWVIAFGINTFRSRLFQELPPAKLYTSPRRPQMDAMVWKSIVSGMLCNYPKVLQCFDGQAYFLKGHWNTVLFTCFQPSARWAAVTGLSGQSTINLAAWAWHVELHKRQGVVRL